MSQKEGLSREVSLVQGRVNLGKEYSKDEMEKKKKELEEKARLRRLARETSDVGNSPGPVSNSVPEPEPVPAPSPEPAPVPAAADQPSQESPLSPTSAKVPIPKRLGSTKNPSEEGRSKAREIAPKGQVDFRLIDLVRQRQKELPQLN